ncbi:MAG TPA: ABC transporter permease [Phycisphaerae bacterium]|nr:ABC transporter permease [Phycisphaerae bacterium]
MIRKTIDRLRRVSAWLAGWLGRTGQNVATAFGQIWANRGRSLLTTLGVIIAVTAIISVVAFVQGFGQYMTNMLRGYGTQYMIVRPDIRWEDQALGLGTITLDAADIEAVRVECPDIRRLTPFVYSEMTTVSYGRATATDIPLRGVTAEYQTIRNYYVDRGRFFGPLDVQGSANVCVVGRSTLKSLECDESILGDYLNIVDQRFKVIGILEPKGSFMGDDQDQTIMIPSTTMLQMFPQFREQMRFLAEAAGEEKIDDACGQVRRVLRQRHGLAAGQPDDFEIDRQDQMLREFGKVRMIATSVLAGIVSISLIVGGIGIMNVMFVSVSERTREIGLRKSVGGRRRDILLQFLTEAVVLSTTGGAIGVALGYGITHIASLHPAMVSIEVPLWSVALALGFSAGSGILFGIIPAFKAAILHPIDALRHE